MIFSTSLPRFKAFLGDFSCKSSDLACCMLFLSPFLLPSCRRSVSAAARSILNDFRDAGWLLRWLGLSTAPQAMLAAAQVQLLAAATDASNRLHVLVIDSTYHGQQGKSTQNTIATGNKQKRPTKSDRHQKKHNRHSGHCFVFALLLTPNGIRIPYWLPYFTKPYGEFFGIKHLSQASLAAQLIDNLPLPQGSRVVVVGDTAFEAKQIRQACARRDWQWVVPLNPEPGATGPVTPRPKVRSLFAQLDQQRLCQGVFPARSGRPRLYGASQPVTIESQETRTHLLGAPSDSSGPQRGRSSSAVLETNSTDARRSNRAEGAHQQRGEGNHGRVASLVLFEMANRGLS